MNIEILGIVKYNEHPYTDIGIAYDIKGGNNAIGSDYFILPLISYRRGNKTFQFNNEEIRFRKKYWHYYEDGNQTERIKKLDYKLDIKYPQISEIHLRKKGCLVIKNQVIIAYGKGKSSQVKILDFKNSKIETITISDIFLFCIYIHETLPKYKKSKNSLFKSYDNWVDSNQEIIEYYRKNPKHLKIKTEITLSPKKLRNKE